MALGLMLLYRGPLSSCNYGCGYCPFAKHTETAAEHAADAAALDSFVQWVAQQTRPLSVFFTPWGEALVRPRYQEALSTLSQLPHVQQLAIQTNLSGKLQWLAGAERAKIALWCTYHPSETNKERFLQRCAELDEWGVRYSVGVVGKKSHFADIAALRAALPQQVYVWVNAYKVGANYYSEADLALLQHIDPLFEVNTRRYHTQGHGCGAGETSLSIDGDGTARRCHFISRPLGNIYEQPLEDLLQPRRCSRPRCECHIGYVHLPELAAERVYGSGLLARIPQHPHEISAYLERAAQLRH